MFGHGLFAHGIPSDVRVEACGVFIQGLLTFGDRPWGVCHGLLVDALF